MTVVVRALIAGCGYVGSRLAEMLVADGHEVYGLRRNPTALPQGVLPIAADLLDRGSLERIPRDVDVAFYTAAASGRDEEAYRAAYVDGLTNFLDALDRDGRPDRVLFTSSTGVFPERDGGWVDEDSPVDEENLVRVGERTLAASPFEGITVRLSGIYGPARTRLVERVRRGEAHFHAPPLYTNRIHRDDAAGVLRHLSELPSPEPIYVASDHAPADEEEVFRFLAERLGVAPPTPADGPNPRGRNKRCRNQRLAETGYVFRFPTYREGYEALLDEPA